MSKFLDRETYDEWRLARTFLSDHETTLRAALELRRDHFVETSKEARKAHQAGAGNEGGLITNNGYKQMAALFREQAEACVRTLKALNRVTGDEYDYEIDWSNE